MNLEQDMKQIIARAYPDDDERQTLEKIFSALATHQKNFLDGLKNRVLSESAVKDFDENFSVTVKLVKRGDTENLRGVFPIKTDTDLIFADENESPFEESPKPDENIFGSEFFLAVGYDDLKNFCEPKTYRGLAVTADGTTKNFSYTLRRHEKFVRAEKILFDVAALYKVRRPVIFSPYARKAVEIKVDGLNTDDLKTLKSFDLKLAQNRLDGKLLTDRKLCWNVKISNEDTNQGGEVEEYFGSDGQLIRYEYFHTFNGDEKIFVLPNQPCDDLHVTTDDGERKIRLGYNSVLKERGCRIVELCDVEKISDDTFTNEDFPRKNLKLRLRTEGDVEKVLACFNSTTFGKKFPAHFKKLGGSENARPIKIYRREDFYPVSKENRLLGAQRTKPTCFVKFAGGNSIFKTDYANFVLFYMSRNYPEFGWAGVDE